MRPKLIEPDKSNTLVDQMEGTNKEIPRQSQSRQKFQIREKPTNADRSTMTVDLTEEADRNFSPMPKESLLTHASTNHHIEGVMGHDKLSLPINTKDLEMDWHLFELTIAGEELKYQQQQSIPNSQTTESKQLQTIMAPKMHGSINDAAKAKAHAVAKAKKKATEEEKKLLALQQHLRKIRKAKIDKQNCPKYWAKMREWSQSDNARNITTTRIKSYLNAPIVDNFGTLKEEATKFLLSWYHDSKIWLDQPITINAKLISFITGLPLNGDQVPIGSKNPALLEKFTGSSQRGKNSKGLQINSTKSPLVKWTKLIISICLTISGRLSDVKIGMLEAINGVANHGKMYS